MWSKKDRTDRKPRTGDLAMDDERIDRRPETGDGTENGARYKIASQSQKGGGHALRRRSMVPGQLKP
jgi:hypothetical protein